MKRTLTITNIMVISVTITIASLIRIAMRTNNMMFGHDAGDDRNDCDDDDDWRSLTTLGCL